MRTFLRNFMWVVLTTMILGYGAGSQAAEPELKDAQATALQSGGKDVLKLWVPADAKVTNKDGKLSVKRNKIEDVEIWAVKDAKTIDDAIGKLDDVIAEEFKKFKATETKDTTVAGAPAKRLLGDGEEADDGDPGHADIIVFKVGDRVFVACTHGETLKPGAQEMMVAALKTAKAP